jgi:hypothetical protein
VPPESVDGVHLDRTDENEAEIASLGALLGGPAGLEPLLGELTQQGRRSLGYFGRAVHRAFTWDTGDRRTEQWWPQGVTTSADSSASGEVGGRRVLVVSWYAKEVDGLSQGSRLTFVDLDSLRYRHVLLVVPTLRDEGLVLEPLRIHAGGIVWCGPYLHIAATARGFVTCRVDDVMRIPDDLAGADLRRLGIDGRTVASYGYRYVLPARFSYRAHTEDGHDRLRYSFLSLDRRDPAMLIAGEYGRAGQSTRLARFPLDLETALLKTGEDGLSRPVELTEGGVPQMQGATLVDDRWYVTASRGPFRPGSVYVGVPGALEERRFATPMGVEDLTYWPSTDTFWSVSEHPRRRWVFAMRRSTLDRLNR